MRDIQHPGGKEVLGAAALPPVCRINMDDIVALRRDDFSLIT